MLHFASVSSVLAARYRKVKNVRVWMLAHDKVSVRVKMFLLSLVRSHTAIMPTKCH